MVIVAARSGVFTCRMIRITPTNTANEASVQRTKTALDAQNGIGTCNYTYNNSTPSGLILSATGKKYTWYVVELNLVRTTPTSVQVSEKCKRSDRFMHDLVENVNVFHFGRSSQVWRHNPEQRVPTSNLRRYSFGLGLAIAQADARPAMPVSLRKASVWPSPRQTPGQSCPHPSDRVPPYATTKRVGAPQHGPAPRISTRKNPMGGILRRESCHMPIEA